MVAAEGQRQHQTGIERAVLGEHLLLGLAGGQDGHFGVVDDGGGEGAAVAAHVADGEGAADQVLAGDGALLAGLGQTSHGVGQFTHAAALGVADDRHHQAMVGVDGATQVHRLLPQDLFLRVVHIGVQRRVLLQRLGDRQHDEGQHAELGAQDGRVLLALAIKRGDVGGVHHREVHGRLHRKVERLGDLATHATEWNALLDAVGVHGGHGHHRRDWARLDGGGGFHHLGCLGDGLRQLHARGGGFGGHFAATLACRLHIGGGHAATTTGAVHALDVHAQVARDAAHGGGGQRLAGGACTGFMLHLAGEAAWHAERTTHAANHGTGVLALLFLGGCLGYWSRRGGDGRSHAWGRCRRGRRTTDLVANQHAADIDDVAGVAAEFADDTGPGRWHFHNGLVGLHLGDGLVLLHGITDIHAPLDEFGLMHAFTEVGKDEVALVVGLLHASHGCLLCLSRQRSPRWHARCDRHRACSRAPACSRA